MAVGARRGVPARTIAAVQHSASSSIRVRSGSSMNGTRFISALSAGGGGQPSGTAESLCSIRLSRAASSFSFIARNCT